jgi:hypothetical protein
MVVSHSAPSSCCRHRERSLAGCGAALALGSEPLPSWAAFPQRGSWEHWGGGAIDAATHTPARASASTGIFARAGASGSPDAELVLVGDPVALDTSGGSGRLGRSRVRPCLNRAMQGMRTGVI